MINGELIVDNFAGVVRGRRTPNLRIGEEQSGQLWFA